MQKTGGKVAFLKSLRFFVVSDPQHLPKHVLDISLSYKLSHLSTDNGVPK